MILEVYLCNKTDEKCEICDKLNKKAEKFQNFRKIHKRGGRKFLETFISGPAY